MEKTLYKTLDGESYFLSPKTKATEKLCFYERSLPGPLGIMGGYTFAYRGDHYDEEGNVVETTSSHTPNWFHQHVMGLMYDGNELVPNPYNMPLWSNHELIVELFSRWHNGALIWLEITSDFPKCTLAEYIASCQNPSIFTSPIGGIIVISDEQDRPGDVILRIWPIGSFNGR